jgi:hypothetical protein
MHLRELAKQIDTGDDALDANAIGT